jgi:hypothetical protein
VRRLILPAGLLMMACGSSMTAPSLALSPVQMTGRWDGTETITSTTGGECLDTVFQSSIGGVTPFILVVSQLGSALSVNWGYPPGISRDPGPDCAWTGTTDSNKVSLNAISINCTTNVLQRTGARVRCPGNPALLRDLQIVAGAATGTVSGNTATGTKVDTYNVLVSGTQTVVGTLIVNSNFSMTCAACGPSGPSANYPNLLGTWTGYMNQSVITNGASGRANRCSVTWSVRAQNNGGDFGGSFTAAPSPISGDTIAPCAQPTAFSGRVSTSKEVTVDALAAETVPGCALQGQSLLRGLVADTKLLLHQENYFLCGTTSTVQFVNFDLTRSGS